MLTQVPLGCSTLFGYKFVTTSFTPVDTSTIAPGVIHSTALSDSVVLSSSESVPATMPLPFHSACGSQAMVASIAIVTSYLSGFPSRSAAASSIT